MAIGTKPCWVEAQCSGSGDSGERGFEGEGFSLGDPRLHNNAGAT